MYLWHLQDEIGSFISVNEFCFIPKIISKFTYKCLKWVRFLLANIFSTRNTKYIFCPKQKLSFNSTKIESLFRQIIHLGGGWNNDYIRIRNTFLTTNNLMILYRHVMLLVLPHMKWYNNLMVKGIKALPRVKCISVYKFIYQQTRNTTLH